LSTVHEAIIEVIDLETADDDNEYPKKEETTVH